MTADQWAEIAHQQLLLCARFTAIAAFPDRRDTLGLSTDVGGDIAPLNGLRHPPTGGSCGWFLWAGEALSEADDFFAPVHYEHLPSRTAAALPYLALPPGWRFLVANGYEDVWFDSSLLDIE